MWSVWVSSFRKSHHQSPAFLSRSALEWHNLMCFWSNVQLIVRPLTYNKLSASWWNRTHKTHFKSAFKVGLGSSCWATDRKLLVLNALKWKNLLGVSLELCKKNGPRKVCQCFLDIRSSRFLLQTPETLMKQKTPHHTLVLLRMDAFHQLHNTLIHVIHQICAPVPPLRHRLISAN